MPKIAYVTKRLRAATLSTIAQANTIIAEYAAQGFTLTLRQLYYQFVARDFIPNNVKEYSKLGDTISDGRLVGLIDWNAIIDRTRNLQSVSHWEDPASIVSVCASSFRMDKWAKQDFRPEVWIEKDALAGVIEGVCTKLDVPYFSCRGYTSQTEMWAGAMRLKHHIKSGQTPLILHFGDHDPSGMDMTRDIRDRLEMFMGGTKVNRLALNIEQINEYDPPPNPAKFQDPRAAAYIQEFGEESWELDALEPSVLAQLIEDAILKVRDEELWEEAVAEENEHRELLAQTSSQWDEVVDFLRQ